MQINSFGIVLKPVNCLVSAAYYLHNIPNNCPTNSHQAFNSLLIYLSAKYFRERWHLSIIAARVTKLGIGASLTTKEFNASTLARKIDTLITSQVVLDRCKAYAERIHPDRSLTETCTVIQEFATTSRRAPAP